MKILEGQVYEWPIGNPDGRLVIFRRYRMTAVYRDAHGRDHQCSHVFIRNHFKFLGWDAASIRCTAPGGGLQCPWCSQESPSRLQPTLFDYLWICPRGGAKIRLVDTREEAHP